jgi:DNA-binding PucR family transcriptional regulator
LFVVNRDSRQDAIAKNAAVITSRLGDKLDDITSSVQKLLVADISELRGDEQLLQLLRDTVSGNIDTFFSAVRNGIPGARIEPPTAALEYARRLAQRDVSANALSRAYRLGHRAALKFVLDEIRASKLEPTLSLDVYEYMEAGSFGYIDEVSQRVVAVYQEERERWLEKRNTVRAAQVRELLSGGEIDVDSMTAAIRYPLKRVHLAVVLWCRESASGDELALMERFVNRFAESVGTRESSLFISVDRVTAWAWIPVPPDAGANAVAQLRDFAAADGQCVAAGIPLPGVDGFRRSHRQAQAAHAVATTSGATDRQFTAVSDTGIALAALLANNVEAASAWVHEVLGPLGSPTDGDKRLRNTLRTFLGTGSSYKAAAEALHLHSNTVKYRVQRAVDRRGRPIDDDRLDVEVALLLCYWFDSAVTRRVPPLPADA